LFTAASLIFAGSYSDISQVINGALWLLSRVPPLDFVSVTSGASVEAKLLDRILDMLEDSSTAELYNQAIFEILFQLTLHESTAVAVVEADMLQYFEKRLRSPTATLRPEICWILRNLTSYSSTVTAVLDMGLYDVLATLWRYVSPHLSIFSEGFKVI
jgi:hypothetical protein